MSFYLINDTKFSDGAFFVNSDIGIFNEGGIKEAKKLLYEKCRRVVQDSLDREVEYFLNPHKEEQKVLSEMLKYFDYTGKLMEAKDAVIKRLDKLEKKVTDEQLETQRLIHLLNSDNMDDVIKEAGYEIVEIPVLDHCNDEILKEFL